ncbi:MAG: ABC transporter substrate-binding protein [Pleomorphochaeta sp.]
MKNLKKLVVVAFVLIFATGIMFASGASEKSDKTEIRVLTKWPEELIAPYWQEQKEIFEASHPNVEIVYEHVADEPIKEKLRVMLGGGDVPDIFFSWSGEFLGKFVRSGAALDISDYYANDSAWKNSFIPSTISDGSYDGAYYGVPIRFSAKFFCYNTELFAKAGITEKPSTWTEFIADLEKLKANNITPILMGNSSPWVACHYLTTLNEKYVPLDVLKKDYSLEVGAFTDPGYIQALQTLYDLTKYMNDSPNSTQNTAAREMFYAGQGAIHYDEIVSFEKRLNANMTSDWDFFPCPTIEGANGNQDYITGAADLFLVSSKSENKDLSVEFLKQITSAENAQKWSDITGYPSGVNSVKYSGKIQAGVNLINNAEGFATWLDTATPASVADVYLANLQLLIDGSKTPSQIMQEVQKEAARAKSEL